MKHDIWLHYIIIVSGCIDLIWWSEKLMYHWPICAKFQWLNFLHLSAVYQFSAPAQAMQDEIHLVILLYIISRWLWYFFKFLQVDIQWGIDVSPYIDSLNETPFMNHFHAIIFHNSLILRSLNHIGLSLRYKDKIL